MNHEACVQLPPLIKPSLSTTGNSKRVAASFLVTTSTAGAGSDQGEPFYSVQQNREGTAPICPHTAMAENTAVLSQVVTMGLNLHLKKQG